MMQAFYARGGQLSLEETPIPEPDEEEVCIQVQAIGVNRADILQRKGKYPPPPGVTSILGLECTGIVEAVGTKVSRWQVGDRVMALVSGGAYAAYCCAHEALCFALPEALSPAEGACLPEACFTFWNSLVAPELLREGETILIHGGTGGIGIIAAQLAQLLGLQVFTTVRDVNKAKISEGYGSDRAICYSEQDFVAVCQEETDNRGVDVILDCVGGSYLARNIAALAPGGRLIQIACQASPVGTLPLIEVMRSRLTITGATLRDQSLAKKKLLAVALEPFLKMHLESGPLKPYVGAVFPFEEAPQAHAFMESQKHVGKIVLNLS